MCKILDMEEVDGENYDRLFHAYSPKFTNDVNAREIALQLLSSNILQ